jgi:alpha-glucoside transport system permease protein
MQDILVNNLLWIVVVTSCTVGFGLLVAVMVDRLGRIQETIAKALIFLPMAISAVGASVIWKFMYHQVTFPDKPQIGLLNAIRVNLGMDTISYIREQPLNKYALMMIMIWLLTGYCMVILSAAVKGVPTELLEAARIDGANEIRAFFSVTVPVIMPTILTVATTVLIMVLKVFDIIYVFGAERYGGDVIANRMFRELFTYRNYGLGSALASVLLIAVLPMIFWNIRSLRKARR